LQRVDGEFKLDLPPKSQQSRRRVPLPDHLVAILHAHHERQEAEHAHQRESAGERFEDWGLVFCTRYGKPLDGPNVTRYFQAALRAAGLPRMKFHGLRHTCASLLAAQGLSADAVRHQLGHADIRMTLNIYTHQFDADRRRTADAMDDFFGDRGMAAD
jgi:integrase